MKCPNDQIEMEYGITDGGWWRGKGITTAMANMFGKKLIGAVRVYAYHCPKCGKIELTTQVSS